MSGIMASIRNCWTVELSYVMILNYLQSHCIVQMDVKIKLQLHTIYANNVASVAQIQAPVCHAIINIVYNV